MSILHFPKIIDDGHAKGIYVTLKPDGEAGTDAKIKNIRVFVAKMEW